MVNVLFPTGIDWRKNVDRTIEAYGALPPTIREQHQLVLACRLDPWMMEALQEQARAAGIAADQLVLPGYLTDEELVALYQHAKLAIFPSLYEGFGLPALEAMHCGTPVICANNSSLREVQTYADARFDATSTEAITEALRRALTDPQHRRAILEHRDPGFTWSRSANLLADALRMSVPEVQRPSLAVVSPLPPQASGIANYAGRLLPGLAQLVDVTVFTSTNDEEGKIEFEAVEGVETKPLAELTTLHHGGQPFDRILYMMGNSRFHVKALQSLRDTGGAVIFHDARFTGLYNEMYRIEPDGLGAPYVGAKLAELYPDRYREVVADSHTIEAHEAHRFGIQMAKEIASLASHRFCHSEYAARILQLDTGEVFDHAFDLPLPSATPSGTGRLRDTVCAFGIVDPMKRAEPLIDACALVQRDGLKLRFVGECDPTLRRHLQFHADSVGVAVEFTGFVSDQELAEEQRAATIAVQLREYSNGESSGALAELLAAETPTITSRIGALAELPSQACRFVEPGAAAADIANAISELLSDPHAVLRTQEAARHYAEEHTYKSAAQKLCAGFGPDRALAASAIDEIHEVLAIAALQKWSSSRSKLVVVEPARFPGDLFQTCDLLRLSLLNNPHEFSGFNQRVKRSGIEPSYATA